MQLTRGLAERAVDHASAPHRRPFGDRVGPALDVLVLLHLQELARAVDQALDQAAVPRPHRDIGDRVFPAGEVFVVGQAAVEHVELALHLHREAVDRVLDLDRRVGVEVAESAAEVRRAAHLPEQPGQTFGPRRASRHQRAELLGQVHQDGARLEHADRRLAAAIQERGDLRVRVHLDEPAAELIAVVDLDQPRVVLRAAVPELQQLLEHHGDLHPVGRRQRVELQRMASDRQLLLVGRTRDGSVDRGERSAVGPVPGPDLRRHILGLVRHRPLDSTPRTNS